MTPKREILPRLPSGPKQGVDILLHKLVRAHSSCWSYALKLYHRTTWQNDPNLDISDVDALDILSLFCQDARMHSGPEQFKDWMDRREFNQAETADFFGWDQTFISQLLRGARKPGLANAVKIEEKTGIPVEAWLSSPLDTSVSEEPVAARKRR